VQGKSESKADEAAHSTTTTPFSIKQAKQVVKFAASALCSEKAESVPRLAGCFPLGAGKVFDACTKQPAQKKP